ncbi:Uncharacterised protein [Yersinia frederiksenii]|nr:Uncharacterised protein [Yersinia frederiksenii]
MNQPKTTEILISIILTLFSICLVVYVVGDAMKGVH